MSFSKLCKSIGEDCGDELAVAARQLIEQYSNTLTIQETADLARAIAASGKTLCLPAELGPFADCPSTGGAGSLTTLVAPLLLVASGLRVPKISASGSIAGAIDTLAMLPSFRSQLDENAFVSALARAGIAHVEQTIEFCPADAVLIQMRRKLKMMANVPLATASLLSKKLIVPGTTAGFDFRVGPAGNIGNDLDSALKAAEFFVKVAELLDIRVSITCTENRVIPSSAFGRVESLQLLNEMVGPGPMLDLDRKHQETCIVVAAACAKAARRNDASVEDMKAHLRKVFASGGVGTVLEEHLCAQGSNMKELSLALEMSNRRRNQQVVAWSEGYWVPPDVRTIGKWIKNSRTGINAANAQERPIPQNEVGVRFHVSPLQAVQAGQLILEAHLPEVLRSQPLPRDLAGHIKPDLRTHTDDFIREPYVFI